MDLMDAIAVRFVGAAGRDVSAPVVIEASAVKSLILWNLSKARSFTRTGQLAGDRKLDTMLGACRIIDGWDGTAAHKDMDFVACHILFRRQCPAARTQGMIVPSPLTSEPVVRVRPVGISGGTSAKKSAVRATGVNVAIWLGTPGRKVSCGKI